MSYSRLNNTTKDKRDQLQKQLDDFATFMWRGESSFEKYGAFIINGGNDLKFYNGASFSNEYSSPQYQGANTNLLGISFKTQTIDFQVGVYWVTDSEYQQFIEWLNPYQVDYLSFSFNKKYGYLVKLANISNSTRHILGRNANSEYMYYTELKLSWELQGPACARAINQYEILDVKMTDAIQNGISIYGQAFKQYTIGGSLIQDYENTKIETPLLWSGRLIVKPNSSSTTQYGKIKITGHVRYGLKTTDSEYMVYAVDDRYQTDFKVMNGLIDNSTLDLFTITFNNITSAEDTIISSSGSVVKSAYGINFTYDSETGIIYQTFADGTRKILNLLTTTTTGENIIDSFATIKFKVPGILSNVNFDMYNLIFYFTIDQTNLTNATASIENSTISCYGRTNVI